MSTGKGITMNLMTFGGEEPRKIEFIEKNPRCRTSG
jgi:hypothetical protein